jgi:hypothetical protein
VKAHFFVLAMLVACSGGDASSPDAQIDAAPGPVDDIDLQPGEPLPPGAWLLANRWDPAPEAVLALDPADLGGPARTVFTASRVWAMGASADGSAIVFSGHDPMRETQFGLTLLDSIQNSFTFDTKTGTVAQLAPAGSGWANVNDECFQPSADREYVYLCRRYDFTAQNTFLGWRLGRIRVADGSFEFLRPETSGGPFELTPQELPGGTKVLFELRARPPASGVALHTRELSTGIETMVRANARRPILAPDGHRVLFADTTDQSRLKTFDLQSLGDPAVPVSPTLDVGDGVWSPDGNAIVYTVFDQTRSCDHLERVTWSGTAWSAPVRVRDCAQTGEVITSLAWVVLP